MARPVRAGQYPFSANTGPSACTAVGAYGTHTGNQVALAERWNGAKWRIQKLPVVTKQTVLDTVSCTSSRVCIAVGYLMNKAADAPRPLTFAMSYDRRMRRRATDYAAAAVFLVLFAIGGLVTTLLSPHESAALRLWASTNVANLQHHPVPALVLSAFLPSGSAFAWLAPIALTMFAANRAVGTAKLALICAAGHLIGTGVSEGIVAYRLDHRSLPPAWSHIADVGPSYVVVSAIVVAVMFGTWLTRATALAVFAVLVFITHIFAGLTSLQVAAVGHLTAIVTAVLLGLVLAVGRRGAGAGPDRKTPAPDAAAKQAPAFRGQGGR